MPFIPHTEVDTEAMLREIGVANIENLFDEIPENLRVKALPPIPPSLTEMELTRLMKSRAAADSGLTSFIGAGAYEHHIPAAVWEVTSRGEFLTAYTPYQAEASQGTLQLLYEYQTMMASLMGLDVSNASLYEGATALAEAILMAVRANRRNTSHRIVIPQSVHPYYREVVKTIVSQLKIEIIELPFHPDTGQCDISSIASDFTALVIPQPNFFGQLEEVDALTDWAHEKNALVIGVVNPLAMSLIKPPGQWGKNGADIACGEGQPLGVPMASGGPYYGFLCCKKDWVRQLPGRIVGRTVDKDGKQGFVLTLQAREQHIRRAKATSNICTNQGLLVTASTIYMSLLGPMGLRQVALASHQNLRWLKDKIENLSGVKVLFSGTFFHEMVLQFSYSVTDIIEEMDKQQIAAGLSLEHFYPKLKNTLLVCVTETKSLEDLEQYVDCLQKTLAKFAESPFKKISGE